MKKNNKVTFGAIIVGAGTFGLLGWSVAQSLIRNNTWDPMMTTIAGIAVGTILGLLIALQKPLFAEVLGYGIPVLLLLQFLWDFGANDLNHWRWVMFIGAIIIFILNLFTGSVKIGGGKRVIKRQLGL